MIPSTGSLWWQSEFAKLRVRYVHHPFTPNREWLTRNVTRNTADLPHKFITLPVTTLGKESPVPRRLESCGPVTGARDRASRGRPVL